MEILHPSDFKHTTLSVYPESPLGSGAWTPKRVGVTLLDEEPGFTGVYIRDEQGGLWPARTGSHQPPEHHKRVCDAWLAGPGVHQDRRSVKP
jgi:hypothetical protein